jgi:Family of unknown function (DUF5403)
MAKVNKTAAIIAARIAGESLEMDAVADTLVGLAKTEAAKHRDSGTFSRSIVAKKVRGKDGVQDRLVMATDPLGAIKEFGHVIRVDGDDVGYVKGQHSMGNAVGRIPEVRT